MSPGEAWQDLIANPITDFRADATSWVVVQSMHGNLMVSPDHRLREIVETEICALLMNELDEEMDAQGSVHGKTRAISQLY